MKKNEKNRKKSGAARLLALMLSVCFFCVSAVPLSVIGAEEAGVTEISTQTAEAAAETSAAESEVCVTETTEAPNTESASEPGTDSGTESASEPGTDSGTEPSSEPGTDSGKPVAEQTNTETVTESTTAAEQPDGPAEKSLYDQLMAAESAKAMFNLLDGSEAPSFTVDELAKLTEKANSFADDDYKSGVLASLDSLSNGGENKNAPAASVTAAKDTYTVYVYVAAKDLEGNAMSAECLELLGIDSGTIDGNGYFPAGQIEISKSLINSKAGYNTPGEPLITSSSDWNAVLAALGQMDTSTLIDEGGVSYSKNRGNAVGSYISQAAGDINYTWGSQRTALFRWNSTEDYGFANIDTYHLDLRFTTNKITFYFGNNGIQDSEAADGKLIENRVYITGSAIQNPKNFSDKIPAHYNWDGKYYSDADCTKAWTGIGTALNSDQTVYIKLVPEDKLFLNYQVAGSCTGMGTVDISQETIYKSEEKAVGSTAGAEDGYIFDGWYFDDECREKVPDEWVSGGKITPVKPGLAVGTEWVNNTTYYAKFVPSVKTITIKKLVNGNMGDKNKEFSFTVSSTDGTLTAGENSSQDGNNVTAELHHGETAVLTVTDGATITITESGALNYEVSVAGAEEYTVDAATNTKTSDTKSITLKVKKEGTIEITNTDNETISTGILLDTAPYILVITITVLGAVVVMVQHRRRYED